MFDLIIWKKAFHIIAVDDSFLGKHRLISNQMFKDVNQLNK